jgi:nicotinamidase-related amidase
MAEPISLEPKQTTLIVIDMINAIAKGQGPPYNVPPNRQSVIDNFQRLIAHCRHVGTPIIYCTNERRPDGLDAPKTISDVSGGAGGNPMAPGSVTTQVIDELAPQDGDFLQVKTRFSAFYGTNVESILRSLGTETILVGGISTQRSVEGTARDAKNRDMQCIVVSDCCTAGEQDVHQMTIDHVLPLLVRVRNTDEVIQGLK